MSYASSTDVTVDKSIAQIKGIVQKFGGDDWAHAERASEAIVSFSLPRDGGFTLSVLFRVQLPDRDDDAFTRSHGGKRERSADAAYKAWEQACRARWRALFLAIKAKLVAVEEGISTVEQEFLAHTRIGGLKTIGDEVIPQLEEIQKKHVKPLALLPGA